MGSKDADLKKRKNKQSIENKKNKETSNSDPLLVAPVRHGGEGTAGGGTGGRKVVTDPRFSSLHMDPRFREAPKHKTKVAIDSRFDRMFTDKSFLSSSAPVDKRGKPKKSNSQQSTLRHYYKIEEEAKRRKEEEVEESSDEEDEDKEEEVEASSDEEDGGKEEEVEESSDEDDENEEEVEESSKEEDEEEEDEKEQKLVKPKSVKSGDDTEDESESDVLTDESEEEEEAIPAIEKETHRLAIVNMDWRHVKAVDLYAMLSSFVPPNGHIKSVAVYPSEFGLQRMKEEEVHGPVALFDDENDNSKENSGKEDECHEKLLDYEKDRMRYYFAVVECDSVNTADHIYKECDGFMISLNPLDLRFIPDSMEFKHPPRDVASEVPANYDYEDFSTGALQHTDVKLTWEEDEPDRARTLRRKFTDEELAELELKEFLASDESESDNENKKETGVQPDKKDRYGDRYRALLQSGNGSDAEGVEDGQDMEVIFNTGLEDISKRILEKKDKKSETVWEEQLRKRRERKRARKNKSKYSSDDDSSDDTNQEATKQEDDFFLEEPASKKRKAKGKFEKQQNPQDMDEVDGASKQELELLLADDRGAETSLKGYNLKLKTSKGKKGREAIKEEKLPSTDLDDPRFAAFFNSAYAMDPTDPQFKRSAAYYRQLAQKEQKVDMGSLAEGEHVKLPGVKLLPSEDVGMVKKGEKDGSDVSKSKKYELSSLVKSIKLKSKQVQLPSDGKTERNGKVKLRGKEK